MKNKQDPTAVRDPTESSQSHELAHIQSQGDSWTFTAGSVATIRPSIIWILQNLTLDCQLFLKNVEKAVADSEWKPTTATELSRMMADNFAGTRHSLIPCGGRTFLNYGYPITGEALPVSTLALNHVIDYPSRDMTVTVETGMRVEKLQEILAEQNQRLPIDIPEAHRATIGGAIASNASGPGQFGFGTFRDYVIGISAVDGQGRLFSAGGRVVKNVAGYDLCKLLTGSLGLLGVITQVTLKVRPITECRKLMTVEIPDASQVDSILEAMNLTATQPAVIDLLNGLGMRHIRPDATSERDTDRYFLCLGYEGTVREVDWQLQKVAEEITAHGQLSSQTVSEEAADKLWTALTEFQVSSDDPLSFRASILPSKQMEFVKRATENNIAIQSHAGNGIILGHFSDGITDVAQAKLIVDSLRESLRSNDGYLVFTHCEPDWRKELDLFGPPTPAWKLMKQIKQTLDPTNLLNPGKLWQPEEIA